MAERNAREVLLGSEPALSAKLEGSFYELRPIFAGVPELDHDVREVVFTYQPSDRTAPSGTQRAEMRAAFCELLGLEQVSAPNPRVTADSTSDAVAYSFGDGGGAVGNVFGKGARIFVNAEGKAATDSPLGLDFLEGNGYSATITVEEPGSPNADIGGRKLACVRYHPGCENPLAGKVAGESSIRPSIEVKFWLRGYLSALAPESPAISYMNGAIANATGVLAAIGSVQA